MLGTDLLILATALLVAFSKRAKSFEMILIGRFLFGVSAGKVLGHHRGSLVRTPEPRHCRQLAKGQLPTETSQLPFLFEGSKGLAPHLAMCRGRWTTILGRMGGWIW